MFITVSIVEDDIDFSQTLRKIIDAQESMECISCYSSGKDANLNLPDNNPTVILMDIQLPDVSGVDLVKKYVKEGIKSHIIMCTSFDDDEQVFSSLKFGAKGYILKTDSLESIITAIRDVFAGGAPMSMSIAKKVITYFNQLGEKRMELDILTKRELEILEHLALGLLYKEISDRLHIGLETVKKHVGNIYKKLEVGNRTEALKYLSNY